MNYLTTNLQGKFTRVDVHQGRDHLVVPVVMLVEGVFNGSNGPLYYPVEELSKNVGAWNGVPIVLYHPTVNGQGVSANDPAILAKQGVGMVKNAKWDKGKLRAEAWIDMCRLTELDPELDDRLLRDGFVLEVSTGLFTENEHAPGWYGGKNFEFVARNHRPDHLALLPDQVGACSVKDGCGLGVFNQSYGPNRINNKEQIMDIHMTGHPLFPRQGAPVMNRGGGDRDDSSLPLPVLNWEDEKPTNNCNCGCAGHSTARETEADIDKQFDRATAIAESMSMVSNGHRDVLPAPRMFGPPPSGGIRLGGGEPVVNQSPLFAPQGVPVQNRSGEDSTPLPLPVMVF